MPWPRGRAHQNSNMNFETWYNTDEPPSAGKGAALGLSKVQAVGRVLAEPMRVN